MKRQRIGRLRHRVTFEKPDGPAATRAASGQLVEDWVDVATVWASVEPLSGRELFQARQVQADVTHRVYVRYRDDVRANAARWRLVHRGRTFAIVSAVDLVERERFLELLCVERV